MEMLSQVPVATDPPTAHQLYLCVGVCLCMWAGEWVLVGGDNFHLIRKKIRTLLVRGGKGSALI